MRETPGVSVWPTVSDSMLKPRRRKSDDHAVQHAGLVLDVDDEGVQAHASAPVSTMALGRRIIVVEVGAGRHHRVDRVLLLDAEVDEHRARGGAAPSSTAGTTSLRVGRRACARRPKASASFTKSGLTSGVAA